MAADRIEPAVREFIERQHVFFVATAPLARNGHVNLSPKGLDSLRVLDDRTVAYLDLTGSGVETIAHLKENGRITLMFCAFEGEPKIVRVYGRGEVLEPGDPGFAALRSCFPPLPGVRAMIRVRVQRVAQSCGYGVPVYQFVGEREQLVKWAERKGEAGLRDYQLRHNLRSIDGLPGLDVPGNPVPRSRPG
ncbi:MAG: pyridoxamine 5'-phosphate oxidase family protein [Candidatus Binatia bacterium]|nr:pyridoxamine 5'-phosphate oxidase family protein [Candidatus Binatia bacterium]